APAGQGVGSIDVDLLVVRVGHVQAVVRDRVGAVGPVPPLHAVGLLPLARAVGVAGDVGAERTERADLGRDLRRGGPVHADALVVPGVVDVDLPVGAHGHPGRVQVLVDPGALRAPFHDEVAVLVVH